MNTVPSYRTRSGRARTCLKWVLLLSGLLTLFALPAVFMPLSWMDSVHRHLGLGPLPQGPIVQYLARSASALYAAFGAMTLVLASDVKRFAPLVTWWGVTAILFGAVLLWIDLSVGMPNHWTWGEGPFVAPLGALVLALQWMARDARAA